MNLITKIRNGIGEHAMLPEGCRVIAGVSGGADSVLLFHVLRGLAEEGAIGLTVIHVHHGIRGAEADRDMQFTEELCRRYGVVCRSIRRDIPSEAAASRMTLEEAGRRARREILEAEAELQGKEAPVRIALAHHQNDLAETVLFRIARGTGIDGLAAMEPVSGIYIRPLLSVTKAEIIRELSRLQYEWVEDSSNQEDDAARNRIRRTILPLLESEVNTGAVRHLAELSQDALETAHFLREETERRAERVIAANGDEICVSDQILSEPAAMQNRIMRLAVSRLTDSLKDITREHIRELLELYTKAGGAACDLPHGIRAVYYRGEVLLSSGESGKMPEKHRPVSIKKMIYDGGAVPEKRYTKWIDYDRINNTLVVRTRQTGDFLVIDQAGHRKSLSDYFTDRHVPVSERDRMTLVADGSEIVWVVGMRIGYRYRISNTTKTIAELQAGEEQYE